MADGAAATPAQCAGGTRDAGSLEVEALRRRVQDLEAQLEGSTRLCEGLLRSSNGGASQANYPNPRAHSPPRGLPDILPILIPLSVHARLVNRAVALGRYMGRGRH